MPRALQAKQAREIDRKATLCELSLYHRLFWFSLTLITAKHMAQWVESHRTKMALKAVA